MEIETKKVFALTIVLFPLVLLGATAWLVWTGLAIGWNILDALAEGEG